MTALPSHFPKPQQRAPLAKPILVYKRVAVPTPLCDEPFFLPSQGPYGDGAVNELLMSYPPENTEPVVEMFTDTGIPPQIFCDGHALKLDLKYDDQQFRCILIPEEGMLFDYIRNIGLPTVDTEGKACVITRARLMQPYQELIEVIKSLVILANARETAPPFAFGSEENPVSSALCGICATGFDFMQHNMVMCPFGLAHYIIEQWSHLRAKILGEPCTCRVRVCERMVNVTVALFRGAADRRTLVSGAVQRHSVPLT